MQINNKIVKRLGIFCIYDRDGMVDDYIVYMLKAFRNSMTKILAVSNGMLTTDAKNRLRGVVDEILTRENKGLDAYAYRYGLKHEGWDKLSEYDEVVMFNDTIMGPVNSFDDMFEEMNKRDLDFWGITKYYKIEYDPFGTCEYGYIPEHVQAYFIAVRNDLLISKNFRDYWDNFPKIDSYFDAIGKHEAAFTKKFNDMGYKWGVYVETDDIKNTNRYLLMYMPIELVKNRRCPIFKRRMFFAEQDDVLSNSIGNTASDFIKYLSDSKKYDVNMIWDNILRLYNQADIVRRLNLRYVLSGKCYDKDRAAEILHMKKIALVMHLYSGDLIEEMCQYASHMPKEADIFVTTVSEKKKKEIEELFKSRLLNSHIEVRLISDRGRDVSSLLVAVKDCILDYDYVCFIHGKRFTQITPETVEMGFKDKCLDNTLYSNAFVLNMIELLEDNPRLGIVSPPGPSHADYFMQLGDEWGTNYEITLETAKLLEITIPISKEKIPAAPYGTMFWFRPIALRRLYDFDWSYTEFPLEPVENEGTVLDAIIRVYSLAAQQEGYYPAIAMSDYYASIEATNMDYYARTMNNAISSVVGRGYHHDIIKRLKDAKENLERSAELLGERNRAIGDKYELELKSLETMKYMESLQKELADAKGGRYELELKALETMKYVESLQKELDNVKGQKCELELKALETMQDMENLQKKATLKYQLTKFFRK